jgi:small neutral amino acid transporter SnatA (MarC family)
MSYLPFVSICGANEISASLNPNDHAISYRIGGIILISLVIQLITNGLKGLLLFWMEKASGSCGRTACL